MVKEVLYDSDKNGKEMDKQKKSEEEVLLETVWEVSGETSVTATKDIP